MSRPAELSRNAPRFCVGTGDMRESVSQIILMDRDTLYFFVVAQGLDQYSQTHTRCQRQPYRVGTRRS